MSRVINKTAMLLAAGLGTRMRPITECTPKPLIKIGGKALIDWPLDQLASENVPRAIVNVHHLAPQIIAHLKVRQKPTTMVSDETERLLDSGGALVKALPLLGAKPFFVFGCDTVMLDGTTPALKRLVSQWNSDALDVLMLVHPMEKAHCFDGAGDFFIDAEGHLTRRGMANHAPYVYTGVQIIHPRILIGESAVPFSMNKLWNKAISARRMKGVIHDGGWFHVSTPDSIEKTNSLLQAQ